MKKKEELHRDEWFFGPHNEGFEEVNAYLEENFPAFLTLFQTKSKREYAYVLTFMFYEHVRELVCLLGKQPKGEYDAYSYAFQMGHTQSMLSKRLIWTAIAFTFKEWPKEILEIQRIDHMIEEHERKRQFPDEFDPKENPYINLNERHPFSEIDRSPQGLARSSLAAEFNITTPPWKQLPAEARANMMLLCFEIESIINDITFPHIEHDRANSEEEEKILGFTPGSFLANQIKKHTAPYWLIAHLPLESFHQWDVALNALKARALVEHQEIKPEKQETRAKNKPGAWLDQLGEYRLYKYFNEDKGDVKDYVSKKYEEEDFKKFLKKNKGVRRVGENEDQRHWDKPTPKTQYKQHGKGALPETLARLINFFELAEEAFPRSEKLLK